MLPEVTTVNVIKVAAIEWSKMELDTMNEWKELAMMINNLPILGVFKSIPGIIMVEEVKIALSTDHHKFINTIQNVLRNKKISMKNTTEVKKFGNEQVKNGDKVYKSFFLPHLLKISIFGNHYSLFHNRTEIVERKEKSTLFHIQSMERIISLFYINGISAFGYQDREEGLLYSCAGKVILKNIVTDKEAVGHIIDDEKVLLESGLMISLHDIYILVFTNKNGTWLHHYNDDIRTYSVASFHPIRIKICNSGNCHILFSRVVLSKDKTKIIMNK